MNARVKNLFAGLAVFLFSVACCLVGVEILFRTVLSEERLKPAEWSDRPLAYYMPEDAVTLQDRPHSPQKAPNTFRIAVVGDSFTFGPYMEFDDTFSKRLERMLNLNNTPLHVEVINYGVPRYSTSHEVGVVKKAISEQADLVILQITLNDPEIKPYTPKALIGGAVDRFGGLQFQSGLLAHWKTGAFVAKRLYNSRSKTKYIQYFMDLWQKHATRANFNNSFASIHRLAKDSHTPLVAVVFPLIGLPTDAASYPFTWIHEQVKQTCDDKQVPSLDLYESFKGIPIERLQTLVGKDFHPNEIGHRIAAEQIYRFLVEQKAVPPEVIAKTVVSERIGITLSADKQAAQDEGE